ncbi:protein kinase [Penicillium argentinense]|uniref:Protein kinase n=1 Tax=Penicillium argentinense TaxID=1131581 RepID=A0A9W9EPJ9_9EURO|nr:protein kinase [Penicillium argentinense]KAJ5085496.1 protein kinase [Penicillium argentinense]
MDTPRRLPDVHWICRGFIHALRLRFRSLENSNRAVSKELETYRIFSQSPPCPSIVTIVEKPEPLSLRKEWMNDFAQAVALGISSPRSWRLMA